MDRAQKEQAIKDLDQVFSDAGVVVVAHYAGLSVAEMEDFRAQMREAGGSVKVAKNRLAKIALKDKPQADISQYLVGQTLLAYSEDPVTAAKLVEKYSKDNEKLVVLGGAMGEEVLDVAGVKILASMPSREELLSSIAGMLGAPASDIASAMGAPASNLANIVQTLQAREAA